MSDVVISTGPVFQSEDLDVKLGVAPPRWSLEIGRQEARIERRSALIYAIRMELARAVAAGEVDEERDGAWLYSVRKVLANVHE